MIGRTFEGLVPQELLRRRGRYNRPVTGNNRVTTDHDGDHWGRCRSELYYVRLVGEADAGVRVFAVTVDGVKPSAELLADTNDLNTKVRCAPIFHVRDLVLAEADLVGLALESSSFCTASDAVARITDRVGRQLAEEHGGRTASEDSNEHRYRTQDTPTGMYLRLPPRDDGRLTPIPCLTAIRRWDGSRQPASASKHSCFHVFRFLQADIQ